jgi:hypothetical protein
LTNSCSKSYNAINEHAESIQKIENVSENLLISHASIISVHLIEYVMTAALSQYGLDDFMDRMVIVSDHVWQQSIESFERL